MPVQMPIFGPRLRDSHSRGTIEPAVTEPPSGKTTNVTKLKAVANATKTAISARSSVVLEFRCLWFRVLFVCSTVFSLRQYYLVQVQWVYRRYCTLSWVVSQLPRTKNTLRGRYLGFLRCSTYSSTSRWVGAKFKNKPLCHLSYPYAHSHLLCRGAVLFGGGICCVCFSGQTECYRLV